MVMARGLGVRRLMAKFLLLHCMHGDVARPSPLLEEEEEEEEDGGEDDKVRAGFFRLVLFLVF